MKRVNQHLRFVPRRRAATPFVLALLGAALPAAPHAPPKEAAPSDWPVERLVHNLEAQLLAEPDDAGTHYTLGRVHAFAFALERPSLLACGTEGYTGLKDLDVQRRSEPNPHGLPAPTPAETLAHLGPGLEHLRRACALEDSALHELTLAWLLEVGAKDAERVDTPALLGLVPEALPADESERIAAALEALESGDAARAAEARRWLADPARLDQVVRMVAARAAGAGPRRTAGAAELLRAAWLEHAIATYRHCLDLAEKEGLFDDPMVQGPLASRVPREALESWSRLVRERGVRGPDEERRLAEADARLAELDQHPIRTWITPILLALDPCATLDDVLVPDARVPFDLDGDGVDELWPWLAPGAGWLVWDPRATGAILSGRQLFGSASGWLFFEDGYRVLDALDDDRDGRLTGDELTGIALWRDADGDGVSDLGEVRPLASFGIVALATHSTARVGPTLANPCGAEDASGHVLATWDWVLETPARP